VPASLVRNESAGEFFRELLESAMTRQHLRAHATTSFYLVNLLSGFIRTNGEDDADQPLGIRLAQALQADRVRQRDGLRRVGDQSLFISGFFADSLNRSLVDVDYYITLGEYAYGSLARSGDALEDVFDELSDKFAAFVDVLAEVSERSALTSNADVLRLYEKWLRTGSRRSGNLLASKGILPNASLMNTRRVQ
jgi:hypothetical protein